MADRQAVEQRVRIRLEANLFASKNIMPPLAVATAILAAGVGVALFFGQGKVFDASMMVGIGGALVGFFVVRILISATTFPDEIRGSRSPSRTIRSWIAPRGPFLIPSSAKCLATPTLPLTETNGLSNFELSTECQGHFCQNDGEVFSIPFACAWLVSFPVCRIDSYSSWVMPR